MKCCWYGVWIFATLGPLPGAEKLGHLSLWIVFTIEMQSTRYIIPTTPMRLNYVGSPHWNHKYIYYGQSLAWLQKCTEMLHQSLVCIVFEVTFLVLFSILSGVCLSWMVTYLLWKSGCSLQSYWDSVLFTSIAENVTMSCTFRNLMFWVSWVKHLIRRVRRIKVEFHFCSACSILFWTH